MTSSHNARKTLIAIAFMLAVSLASGQAFGASGLVVLLTDFGTDSVYVGAMKGAIYTKFPEAKIDSITNSVPAFDVEAGAYLLVEACAEFPAGTVFCCVVDPGVGTARKCIVLETKTGQMFVAPDNGLLTLVKDRFGVASIHEIANRKLWRNGEESRTFQGRDVFGPVAAALARGVPLSEVGPEIHEMVKLPITTAKVRDHQIIGTVIRADPYGNLITNIRPDDLAKAGLHLNDSVEITIGKAHYTAPLKKTYGDVPEGAKVVVVQSAGYLECAVNMRSLAGEIHEGLHARVALKATR